MGDGIFTEPDQQIAALLEAGLLPPVGDAVLLSGNAVTALRIRCERHARLIRAGKQPDPGIRAPTPPAAAIRDHEAP